MWILSFLPTDFLHSFINTMLVVGLIMTVLGYVLRLPLFTPYRLYFQIIGIVLLSGGLYFKGGYNTEIAWREKVHQMELKVAEAEKKSEELNVKLEKEIKKKQKVIHDTKVVIKEKIKEKKEIINADCKVAPEAIQILNEATIGPLGVKK